MTKLYAGIGSRYTPTSVLECMYVLAAQLALKGYTLRSGGAPGADSAFEYGCDSVCGLKEIWLPWERFENRDSPWLSSIEHAEIAETIHPYWNEITQGPQKLHARNVGQILGPDCQTPVEFVICYTICGMTKRQERTLYSGGTATAIVLAADYNIPVFNLGNAQSRRDLISYLNQEKLMDDHDFEQQVLDLHLHDPESQEIFVFGSNLAGRHGRGAAKYAAQVCGAKRHQGFGMQGRSYAIPTKGYHLEPLSLDTICFNIGTFIRFAKAHPEKQFFVSEVGCGEAGYKPAQIAPFFKEAPSNCKLPPGWRS